MHQYFMYDLIMWNFLPQRKNVNHEKHVILNKVFTYANLLPNLRNRLRIINKVTYIVYKEWSGRALMNEIKRIIMTWMFYRKELLHVCGYWKMILFRRLRATLILVDHETGCVGKFTSLVFHAYEEHPNWRWYASYASIWRQSCLVLRIGNKHGM
jgi:hypothetical protein